MTSAVAIPFVGFAAFLGDRLTLGQRVLSLVAFDGADPSQLHGAEADYARRIFGDLVETPDCARSVVCVVAGARGGKTWLAARRLLHLALTVSLDTLARGEMAFGLFVGPDMRLARQGLRYALGAAQSAPSIARLVSDVSVDGFTLTRTDRRTVRFECLPATRGGSALRGRALVGAVFDESSFFRGDDAIVNDLEIYRAVAPRIMPAGQLLIISTPWTESGLLFDTFTTNHGHPVTAIAAHAPTTLLRDDAHTHAMVDRERANDPTNAAREFDALFVAGAGSQLFDPSAFDSCIVEGAPMSVARPDGSTIAAAIDIGLRSDASALAIVARKSNAFALLHVDEIKPAKGAPLRPSEVCAQFAATLVRFGVRSVWSDSHYVESTREHMQPHGIHVLDAPAGQQGKIDVHLAAKTIVHEGRLLMPPLRAVVDQLRAIRVRPTAGGGLQITSPRRPGSHGDVASAVVLALWAADQTSGARMLPETEIAIVDKFGDYAGARVWTDYGRGY